MRALAAALLLAAPAAAQVASGEAAVVTAAEPTGGEQAAITAAINRGRLIYAYDQAAWHGTDYMLTKLPDFATRVGGWVVVGTETAPTAIFFDKNGIEAVFTARFASGRLVEGKVLGAADDRRLSPETLSLITALKIAREAIKAASEVYTCSSKPFNTVVLPPETPTGSTAVYFMTPQTSHGEYPFGGHYRVEVDGAGRAGQVRGFTKSCLTMSTRPPARSDGKQPAALAVSHLLHATPTEMHVFASQAIRLPIYVITPQPTSRIWAVEGDKIRGPLNTSKR